jgi:hypothetical protein
MHRHICPHCGRDFLCNEPLECFKRVMSCGDCFWKYDFRHFLLFCTAALLAIGLMLIGFRFFHH